MKIESDGIEIKIVTQNIRKENIALSEIIDRVAPEWDEKPIAI